MRRSRRSAPVAILALSVLLLAPNCGFVPVDQMQISAHEDDDTYFMNPAIHHGLRAGLKSWTVYTTAGDAGSLTNGHWQSREQGMKAAYAAMAGVPNVWQSVALSVAGRSLVAFRLDGTRVTLVFLRLPDGNPNGTGYPATGYESLANLWNDPPGYTVTSVDGAQTYTRSELIELLRVLLDSRRPRKLRLMDAVDYHGSDHSDHIHTALFSFEAHLQAPGSREVRSYRTYNTSALPVNLSPAEQADSRAIQAVYQAFDAGAGPNSWNDREMALGGMSPATGHLAWGSECLAASAPAAGATVGLAPCADVSAQRFRLADDRRLEHVAGLCVAATSLAAGAPLELAACADVATQQLTLMTDGLLRARENLCVGGLANGPGLVVCGVLARNWELAASPVFAATGGDFSTAELGTDASRYRSLQLGDVNGDGRDDACARRGDGPWCALAAAGGSFAAATQWHTDFTDSLGWGAVQYGSTLVLGDVTGDGRADLCGRGAAGVWCVQSTGSGFTARALWTAAYSDAAGGNDPAVYGSLRLGDVDGDGRDDLCAREGDTVVCRASTGSAFGAGNTWIGSEWGTALGLPAAQVGRTLMLGDVDGDGDDDLCERGTDGVHCALSDPAAGAFRDPAMRSQGDFSDATGWSGLESYWRSLRLGDLTGDGRADLCGRGGNGLLCLFSVDGRFSQLVHHVARAYSNAAGWSPTERGATIRLGDIDGDGRADVCGAGPSALDCAVLDGP